MRGRWIASITTLGAATLAFGAAAMAQTPPVGTVTPSATLSPGTTTTAVATSSTGTAVSTRTAVATGVVTGTVTSSTPVPTVAIPANIYVAGGKGNFSFANPAFQNVWNRTDRPVAEGKVSRTWFWGPGPNTPGLLEQYKEDPTGRGQRLVQYFDKSRMEINNPAANSSQQFFVTNGLLTVELISGFVQVGEKDFVKFRPACIPMTGDFGDQTAPTYFAFQGVSNTQAGDHNAPDRTGQRALQAIDRNGVVTTDTAKSNIPGINFVHYEAQTKHNIPAVFWDFLNSSGPVYGTNNQVTNEQLIRPWFYASGLPISEPYWARATVNGAMTDVLVQAFERRALTYVPTNERGFQVEMANIGQHYFDWRYRNFGVCAGNVPGTPTPPVPAATGTVVPGTPGATGTAVTTGTPVSTGTVTTGTPVVTTTPTEFEITVTATVGGSSTQTPVGTPVR